MLKVLLVDDEPIITTGLKKLIAWDNLNLELAGVASDGEEALTLITETSPDIIVTDLLMQGMDGIEFIKKLKESGYGCRIIILSGHGEFEYAREALKNNVFEYLLKPVLPQSLNDTLKAAYESIEEERANKRNMSLLEERLRESMPVMREKFFWELFNGTLTDENTIESRAGILGIDIKGDGYTVLCVKIENGYEIAGFENEKEQMLLEFAVTNVIDELSQRFNKSHTILIGDIYYILLIESGISQSENALAIAESISENLCNYFGIITTIGIGEKQEKLSLIIRSCNGAQEALKNKFFREKGSIIHINDKTSAIYNGDSNYNYTSEVLDCIKYGALLNATETSNKLTEQFIILSENKTSMIYVYCYEFFINLKNQLKFIGLLKDPISSIDVLEAEIRKNATVTELKNWITIQLQNCFKEMVDAKKSKEVDAIQQAKDYIEENFQNTITLALVASSLYMSTSYFCSIFKSRTGIGFHEYVLSKRMETAAKLMASKNYKVYEVSVMVGYKNSRYFSEAYKRYFGKKPTEPNIE